MQDNYFVKALSPGIKSFMYILGAISLIVLLFLLAKPVFAAPSDKPTKFNEKLIEKNAPRSVFGEPAPDPPKPPRGNELPAPDGKMSAELRKAARDALKKEFKIDDSKADAWLDLQFKAGDIKSKFLKHMGAGFSQTYYEDGKLIVEVSPQGDIQKAQKILAQSGLTNSEVRQGKHSHTELADMNNQLSHELKGVIDSGNAMVGDSTTGLVVTVTNDMSVAEKAQVQAAASKYGATVKQSDQSDFTVQNYYCNGDRLYGRVCDYLIAGVRYHTSQNGCTLSWMGGPYYSWEPNYFFTAGHCITPGGTTFYSCKASHSGCFPAGWEIGQYDDAYNGDNGLLYGSRQYWTHYPGFVDWRSGGRWAITYYQYYPPIHSTICHGGATTGWHCGVVVSTNSTANGESHWRTHMILSTMYSDFGDSGGPVFTGDHQGAVGLNSGGFNTSGGSYSVSEPIWRPINNYGIWPYGG